MSLADLCDAEQDSCGLKARIPPPPGRKNPCRNRCGYPISGRDTLGFHFAVQCLWRKAFVESSYVPPAAYGLPPVCLIPKYTRDDLARLHTPLPMPPQEAVSWGGCTPWCRQAIPERCLYSVY